MTSATTQPEQSEKRDLPGTSVRPARQGPALLCFMNYPSSTGYAWAFIENLYVELARRMEPRGVRTLVAYPTLAGAQPDLGPAKAVELPLDTADVGSLVKVARFIRRENVKVVYLSDRKYLDPGLFWLRAAGARRIIVHDHSSGDRTAPRGVKWLVKYLATRAPVVTADRVLTVSDFVSDRVLNVGLVPPSKVRRIWNGIQPPRLTPGEVVPAPPPLDHALQAGRPIVMTACRASPEKGVHLLVQAMARLLSTWPAEHQRPFLAFLGDGPQLQDLRDLAAGLLEENDYWMPGYLPDVWNLLRLATVVAVPSIWQDALPLSVLEPMHLGKPIVASRVGGIPEMARDGQEGLLVEPGNGVELAEAIRKLLIDRVLAERLGAAARARANREFAAGPMHAELEREVRSAFGL